MLGSLPAALAMYALGDDAAGAAEIVAPLQDRVIALDVPISALESFLRGLGFEPDRLTGATGFVRIAALADAVEAINAAGRTGPAADAAASAGGLADEPGPGAALAGADHARQRFEILARAIFQRFKALVTEPTDHLYAERHANIEAIYKKLGENQDAADVSDLLKALHRIQRSHRGRSTRRRPGPWPHRGLVAHRDAHPRQRLRAARTTLLTRRQGRHGQVALRAGVAAAYGRPDQ